MKTFLEKLENLIAEFKEQMGKPTEDKVQLSALEPGDVFNTSFGQLIVLEHKNDIGTLVISKDLMKEDVRFDAKEPDFANSEIKKVLDEEILPLFEKEFGSENIVEHEVSRITVDVQKRYEPCLCKVRLLKFDEARVFNDYLVNKELGDWYWTMTPWSTVERDWPKSVAVVSPSGDFDDGGCYLSYGVRPVCILKSNIFVSKKND